jgi:hypothetical protein
MPRLPFVMSVAGMTGVLCIAASCFQDSCACVTVPPTREERWIGVTATRDSLDFSLTVGIGVATTTAGSGHVRIANGAQRSKPGDTLGPSLYRR